MCSSANGRRQEDPRYYFDDMQHLDEFFLMLSYNIGKIVKTHKNIPLDFLAFLNSDIIKNEIFNGLERFINSYSHTILKCACVELLIRLGRLEDLRENLKDYIKDFFRCLTNFELCEPPGNKKQYTFRNSSLTPDIIFNLFLTKKLDGIVFNFFHLYKDTNLFLCLFSSIIYDKIDKLIKHKTENTYLKKLTRLLGSTISSIQNKPNFKCSIKIREKNSFLIKNLEQYFMQKIDQIKGTGMIWFQVSLQILAAPDEFKERLLEIYEKNISNNLLDEIITSSHSYLYGNFSRKYLCEVKTTSEDITKFFILFKDIEYKKMISSFISFKFTNSSLIKTFYTSIWLDDSSKPPTNHKITAALIFSIMLRYWRDGAIIEIGLLNLVKKMCKERITVGTDFDRLNKLKISLIDELFINEDFLYFSDGYYRSITKFVNYDFVERNFLNMNRFIYEFFDLIEDIYPDTYTNTTKVDICNYIIGRVCARMEIFKITSQPFEIDDEIQVTYSNIKPDILP